MTASTARMRTVATGWLTQGVASALDAVRVGGEGDVVDHARERPAVMAHAASPD